MKILEVRDLTKNFDGIRALDHVSMAIERGTIVAIVGDNGAGKSTLTKCITGAEKPDFGNIILDGISLQLGDTTHSRQSGIEMIYQNLALFPQLNVISNIFLGQEILNGFFLKKNEMKKIAQDIISKLNPHIEISKEVRFLSGGQQQVVAIARSLLRSPKLLIMDEPTAALGVQESKKILNLMIDLKNQGISIIVISHRLNEVFEVADRVILMKHGKIIDDSMISETSMEILTNKIVLS